MPHFSDAEVHSILDTRFRSGGSDWIGLSLTVPDDDMSGGISEPVGSGYARVELPRNTGSWLAASDRAIVTDTSVEFPEASGGDWGVIVAWVMFDAATGGDPVTAGRITGIDVFDGDLAILHAGSITILAP